MDADKAHSFDRVHYIILGVKKQKSNSKQMELLLLQAISKTSFRLRRGIYIDIYTNPWISLLIHALTPKGESYNARSQYTS